MKFLIGLISFAMFGGVASALPKVTVVGDYGCSTSAFRNTISNIKNQNPDMHFAVGDLGYQECTAQEWCSYVLGRLPMPFELVVGNHDTIEESEYLSACPDKLEQVGQYGRQSYVDYGGARFITADPAISPTLSLDYNIGQSKGDWLQATIASAEDKWIVVMTHKLCVAGGGHGCELGEDFLDNLLDWGVDLVWQGHAHNYQRSKQLYNYPNCNISSQSYDKDCIRATKNYPRYKAGGMHIVINGTGGRSMKNYQIDPAQPDYPYFRVTNDSSHGPSTLIIGESSLRMRWATNADGVKDEFWIDR